MKRSPAAAAWLSLLPGLGHLYLGQFAKGLALALAVVGVIQISQHGDAFGILIPIFWIYTMIDAHRSAEELNRAIERGESRATGADASLGWAIALIGLGVLWLLANLGVDVFEYLGHLWPVALIVLGVMFLKQGLRRRSEGPTPQLPSPPGAESPAPTEEGTDELGAR